MAIHDIVATTYYLENYDRSKINLEVMIIPSGVWWDSLLQTWLHTAKMLFQRIHKSSNQVLQRYFPGSRCARLSSQRRRFESLWVQGKKLWRKDWNLSKMFFKIFQFLKNVLSTSNWRKALVAKLLAPVAQTSLGLIEQLQQLTNWPKLFHTNSRQEQSHLNVGPPF